MLIKTHGTALIQYSVYAPNNLYILPHQQECMHASMTPTHRCRHTVRRRRATTPPYRDALRRILGAASRYGTRITLLCVTPDALYILLHPCTHTHTHAHTRTHTHTHTHTHTQLAFAHPTLCGHFHTGRGSAAGRPGAHTVHLTNPHPLMWIPSGRARTHTLYMHVCVCVCVCVCV
jgi:hypothetical protein